MDSKENNNTGEAEMEIKEEANNNKDSNDDVKESKIKEGGEENNNNNDNPSSLIPSIEGASPGKIFVGGLPKDTTEEAFTKHFQKYGKIVDSVIMKHRGTRIPRGFGFITYEDPAAVDAVIRDTHTFGGKQVEIKRTLPRGAISGKDFETKKIFVGGIPTTVNEDEFKNFFAKFGEVEEHLLMRDHNSGRSRGFGFISFSSEKAVDDLLIKGNRIEFAGAQVEIKKAEPKKPGGASTFAPPTKQPFSNPRPAFGRGRGRGFKDQHGGVESGSYRYSGGGRSRGYSGYGQSKFDGGYGSTGIGSYRGDGGYGSTSIGSYGGEPSLGFSNCYGGGLGRGYGAGGFKEPSETYGRYGGAAGGYGGGYNFGPLGGSGGGGGYDSGPGAGGYGGSGGYGSGGAGLYGGRQDYGGRGGYEGAPGGRYHPYSR